MAKKAKRLTKTIIAIIIVAAVLTSVLIVAGGLQIAFMEADKIECWHPDYEKLSESEMRAILNKEALDDNDYETLYKQTGLTKIGVDRALAQGDAGKLRILSIQDDYFKEHTVVNDFFAPYMCQDKLEHEYIENIYLENGDIVVSSSTHFSGWRVGHAGLVTDGENEKILQASVVGETSAIGSMVDFNTRVNFMVLSPKVETDLKEQVVAYADENLKGLIYDFTVGVFSSKNTLKKTQCSHLVWSAYKHFGIDLDSNGGLLVMPKDLANSPLVDVVQVFGFDPVKLWK